MAWSYDVSQLETSAKDQVRFLCGDVVETEPLVQDEEILFAISQTQSVYTAAAIVCESIAAMFSRKVDRTTGDVRSMFSQRAKAYAERAQELRAEGKSKALSVAKPLAGGISIADKAAASQDTDRVKPLFYRGQFEGR